MEKNSIKEFLVRDKESNMLLVVPNNILKKGIVFTHRKILVDLKEDKLKDVSQVEKMLLDSKNDYDIIDILESNRIDYMELYTNIKYSIDVLKSAKREYSHIFDIDRHILYTIDDVVSSYDIVDYIDYVNSIYSRQIMEVDIVCELELIEKNIKKNVSNSSIDLYLDKEKNIYLNFVNPSIVEMFGRLELGTVEKVTHKELKEKFDYIL